MAMEAPEASRLRFRDELLDAQLLRTMGSAPYGGADVGECLAVADRIGVKGVDLDRWYAEWSALADRLSELAATELEAGREVSARDAFFRASNYYRTAGVMLLGPGGDRRLIESNRRQTELFRAGASLLPTPPEVLEIPFEGTTLPGYFFPASAGGASADALQDGGGRRATVVLIGGYDATCEELYWANGVAALERGYHVLAFDGPGQGAALIQQGLKLTPDFDRCVSAVLDYAVSRADVDPGRLVLMGLSLGAHLAPRAVSADPRVAACVADCGSYDLFATALERMPPPLARRFASGNPLVAMVLRLALRRVERQPTAGWALRRGQYVHGAARPIDYLKALREFTLRDRAAAISCPLLVCYADRDDISTSAPQLAEEAPEATLMLFTTAEGAGDHCEAGARLLFHARAFAWLDDVLARRSG